MSDPAISALAAEVERLGRRLDTLTVDTPAAWANAGYSAHDRLAHHRDEAEEYHPASTPRRRRTL